MPRKKLNASEIMEDKVDKVLEACDHGPPRSDSLRVEAGSSDTEHFSVWCCPECAPLVAKLVSEHFGDVKLHPRAELKPRVVS